MESSYKVSILDSVSVLVLSTGYEPLFKTSWKRAVSAVVRGRAEIIEQHSEYSIKTGSGYFPLPTKVRFLTGIFAGKIKRYRGPPKLSKKNLWIRDSGKCQYCDINLSVNSCTIDHVIPKSKNGTHTWNNVVLSCSKCNQRKGSRMISECNMRLKKAPNIPKFLEIKQELYI